MRFRDYAKKRQSNQVPQACSYRRSNVVCDCYKHPFYAHEWASCSLPGSKPTRLHTTTNRHMKAPRSTLEAHAAHMAVEATMINLSRILAAAQCLRERDMTYSAGPEGGRGSGGLCGFGLCTPRA